jgi:uncharacterized alpha-E superfamily protein
MLSRVAESIYWMGRYVERAENTARLLDVSFRSTRELSTSFRSEAGAPNDLRVVLAALGVEDLYTERYGTLSEDGIATFLIIDPENPGSVVSCITAARGNARSVRESISTEMWEELNRTYLSLNRATTAYLLIEGMHDFCREIRLGSQLFQGVTDATMPYDEAWHFLQAGKFLERAGTTARILAARSGELQPALGRSGPEDVHRWLSLLRSVSAYEAYMHMRPGGVQPRVVAEFLLLSQSFPRSVAMGLRRVHEELSAIEEELAIRVRQREGPTVLAGALSARLRYTTPAELEGNGLTSLLPVVQDQISAIDNTIRQTYFESVASFASSA